MNENKILVIVAHPDDETLYFSSVIMNNEADIICATCGRDPEERELRKKEQEDACLLLGVDNICNLNMLDTPGKHLNLLALEKKIKEFIGNKSYDAIYTHSVFGDVNEHPHHQDVSYIAAKIFGQVWMNAWNMYADKIHALSIEEYELKKFIMGTIYEREYRKIRPSFEITSVEKYAKVSFEEARQLFIISKYQSFKSSSNLVKEYDYSNSAHEIEICRELQKIVKSLNIRDLLIKSDWNNTIYNALSPICKVINGLEKQLPCDAILYNRTFDDEYEAVTLQFSSTKYIIVITNLVKHKPMLKRNLEKNWVQGIY